jgi:hypothetical protein
MSIFYETEDGVEYEFPVRFEYKGKRVVEVVDTDRLTDEGQRLYNKYCKEQAEWAAEIASERYLRMAESGGY